jgi:divalent metal cation (Fe/Co/Zn/Cd) transporter
MGRRVAGAVPSGRDLLPLGGRHNLRGHRSSAVSILVMPALAYGKQRTGSEIGSRALQADAVEAWVCSYLSFALLAAVGLNASFGWWWDDPAGALTMLPGILWQGWETLEEAREEGEEA